MWMDLAGRAKKKGKQSCLRIELENTDLLHVRHTQTLECVLYPHHRARLAIDG